MKFLLKLLISSVLFIALSQSLFAENNTLNTSTELSVEVEKEKYEVLLLKMEERLEEHIVKAQEVVDRIKSENISFNSREISQLESLIVDLEEILVAIKVANNESQNLTTDEMNEIFTEYRIEIVEISKEFKELTHNLVNEDKREEIKERIQEKVEEYREKREEVREKIQKKEKEFLIKKSNDLAEKYNISELSNLAEEYESGNMSQEEFISQIRNLTFNLQNTQGLEKFKEMREQKQEKRQEKIEMKKNEIQEKRQNALQKKLEENKERTEELIEKLKALSPEQQAKVSDLVGQDVNSMSDEELTKLVETLRPLVNRFLSNSNERMENRNERIENKGEMVNE